LRSSKLDAARRGNLGELFQGPFDLSLEATAEPPTSEEPPTSRDEETMAEEASPPSNPELSLLYRRV
jgi:hypothetical protein